MVKRPKVTRARIDEKPESPNNCNVTTARFDEKPESSSNANVTRARLDEKTESPSNTETVGIKTRLQGQIPWVATPWNLIQGLKAQGPSIKNHQHFKFYERRNALL